MTAVQEHVITPAAPLPPMRPARYLVAARILQTYDTVTLLLRPADRPIQVPRPGQFTMLYAYGVGEIPVSVSGIGEAPGQVLVQTIRAVRRWRTPASRPGTSGSRLSGTCGAAWRSAATASSGRSCSAGTARSSATPRPFPC